MLGIIAVKLFGTKLDWDAANMRFTNCNEANQLLKGPYRAPWCL